MESISTSQSPMMMNPADWQGLTHMNQYSEDQKLKMASGEFESTLIRQYLKDAMKPLIEGGALNENGTANNIYRGYYTDIMAQSLTQGSGIGVSNILQTQLSTNTNHQSKGTTAS